MKILTVCGSLKFKTEMIEVALQMELEGNVMLVPIFPSNNDKTILSKKDVTMLGEMHKEKIKLSDAILVVNVNNYIGESTSSEIKLAKSLDKEILYYTDLVEKV